MNLTSLQENAAFQSLSKVRVLRILLLVQIVYDRSPHMKLIYQSFLRCLPFVFVSFGSVLFFFTWISIVMVKVYKDDEYYCANAFKAVRTREECFESGGDWIKHKLNFSSVGSTLFFGTVTCSTEGWIYKMTTVMDANGKGNAPQYNASEHFQIYFLGLFLVAGIIALNLIMSTVLVNYKKIKEELSGEQHLTSLQRQWLTIKTYILSLEPSKSQRLPLNCLLRSCHKVYTHKVYKLFQGIMLVMFLVVSALYRVDIDAEVESLYWKWVGSYILFGVCIDYFLSLLVFGLNKKRGFILDTCICLFVCVGYALQDSNSVMEEESREFHTFSSAIILLVPTRHIKRKYLLIECSTRSP